MIFKTHNKFSLLKRSIKFWWQRLTRGWDDSDTWSLDMTIAEFILPRLKKYREVNKGIPYTFTKETWNAALDEMIYYMTCIANRYEDIDIDWDRAEIGKALFFKYFEDLWW